MSTHPLDVYDMSQDMIPLSIEERRSMVDEGMPMDEPNVHELDNEQNDALFRRVWTWLRETEDAWAQNRLLRLRDHDFRDGRQWTPEEEMIQRLRGQEPLVFNQLKLMTDWIIGTERRTRIDWNVLPRAEEDVENAIFKKQLLKFVSDINKVGWQRSLAFADAVISGLGWLEDCVVASSPSGEPLMSRYQDWRGMWYDFYSRDPMFRDCRFMFRKKYLDLDYATAMWPQREGHLAACSRNTLAPGMEMIEDDVPSIAMFAFGGNGLMRPGPQRQQGKARERVAVWECWFKEPVKFKRIESLYGDYAPLHGKDYDANNPEHAEAASNPIYALVDGVREKMRLAFFCERGLLAVSDSPYKHNRFPFTPVWGYRDSIDGTPYGAIRQAIDPQRDFNKRKAKSLHLLTTVQVLFEDGAIAEGDEETFFNEVGRPDGRMRVRKGSLQGGAIEIRSNTELAASHVQLMQEDKENILEVSGVTRENVGQSTNAISGKAILAKQQQGAVSTAELFDNLRLAVQESGEKQLCNIEQYMSLPKRFRILGEDGARKWIMVNQPSYDEISGQVKFQNDITEYSADFIVDQQDSRETVRMAQAESLFELVANIAPASPDAAIAILPYALDLTDVPNKTEMVNVVRQRLGMAPAGQEQSEEVKAAELQRKQADEETRQLANSAARADIRAKNARASRDESEATRGTIQGRKEALDAAALAHAAVPVVPAADRLYDGSKSTPVTE